MSSLPEEIMEENILTRLPVKSISRFRCVSQKWRLLFQNPNFIKNHLKLANLMNKFNLLVTNGEPNDSNPKEPYLYCIDNTVLSSTSSPYAGDVLEIDYPFMSRKQRAVQLIGSCDGLVCICVGSYRNTCIWNPTTREYKQVPKTPIRYPSADSEAEYYFIALGFGFDCKNDDYKVLRVVALQGSETSEARIYSLKSNSWKDLGFIPYDFSFRRDEGFLLNGVLHWFAIFCCSGLKSSVALCFNISDDTFHHVPLPNNSSVEEPFMSDFGVWEGKLCLIRTNHTEDPDICGHQNDHIDVWIMMDNKWIKHLKITAQITEMFYRRPFQTLQNGEILFEGGPRDEETDSFISYNHKLERARAMKIRGFPKDFEVETYIETLVALNSGTYVGQQQKGYQRSNTRKRRNG